MITMCWPETMWKMVSPLTEMRRTAGGKLGVGKQSGAQLQTSEFQKVLEHAVSIGWPFFISYPDSHHSDYFLKWNPWLPKQIISLEYALFTPCAFLFRDMAVCNDIYVILSLISVFPTSLQVA